MFGFVIDFPGLERIRQRFADAPAIVGEEMRTGMADVVREAAESVRRFTPVVTGGTRDSIVGQIDNINLPEIRGSVVALPQPNRPRELARWVNDGTRAHVIEPRTRTVLRFSVGGAVRFSKRVDHPGTKGAHMFERGIEAARPRMVRIMAGRLGNVTRRLARG